MKTARERMWERMHTERVMTSISLRIPESVIETLKEIAPSLGISGYQGLIKVYISQGLRRDLERLENSYVQALMESLRKQGVADEVIASAIADAKIASPEEPDLPNRAAVEEQERLTTPA